MDILDDNRTRGRHIFELEFPNVVGMIGGAFSEEQVFDWLKDLDSGS